MLNSNNTEPGRISRGRIGGGGSARHQSRSWGSVDCSQDAGLSSQSHVNGAIALVDQYRNEDLDIVFEWFLEQIDRPLKLMSMLTHKSVTNNNFDCLSYDYLPALT